MDDRIKDFQDEREHEPHESYDLDIAQDHDCGAPTDGGRMDMGSS